MREGLVIVDVCFPGEQPAASGHLLRSRHHRRRRSNPAAALGHVATSRGALPGGSCSCRPRSCQRRQRHAGLAESPSRSSVFLYVPMVKLLANSGTHSHDGRRALHRDAVCGQASAGRQARSRCLTPAWVFGFGERGIRRAEEKELPAAGDDRGSSRKVRDAWLGGHIAGGSAPRLAGASQALYVPGSGNRAPCRSLTADRFEASYCLAPVAGER
jgi:hypothetical protein